MNRPLYMCALLIGIEKGDLHRLAPAHPRTGSPGFSIFYSAILCARASAVKKGSKTVRAMPSI